MCWEKNDYLNVQSGLQNICDNIIGLLKEYKSKQIDAYYINDIDGCTKTIFAICKLVHI